MTNKINTLYEFGGFRFEAEGKTLWQGEKMISLPPKALDLLSLLLEKEGKVVSKQEILNNVWAETFVEEGVLTQNIYKLRNALGTDENGRQFIENIPRRGYRLTIAVKVLSLDEVVTEVSQSAENSLPEGEKLRTGSFPWPAEKDSAGFENKKSIPDSFEKEKQNLSKLRPALFIVLGICLLALIGFGIYQNVNRTGPREETVIAPIEQLRFQRLTDLGDIIFPTISPDGELLAFVRLEAQEGSVWIKQIVTDSSKQILPPSRKGYRSLNFSPDGVYLYFREETDGGAIYQTSILGGSLRRVANNVWSDFSISPDGQQIVFFRPNPTQTGQLLILANIDGSGEREISTRKAPLDYRGTPAWSPDGQRIVVMVGVQQNVLTKLLTVEISDGKETELKTPRWRAISRALWTPNGKYLIVSARETSEPTSQIWMLDYPEGQVRRLTNDLEAYFWLSLSADGRMLVTRQQRIISHLWILPEGNEQKAKQLTFGGRNLDGYVGLAWTPEDKIIFSALTDNITNLYSMNVDGSNRLQLTSNTGQDNTYSVVSRNGQFIVFTSNRTGTTQIWRMDVDGQNQKQLTFGEESTESAQFPTLSPDDKEVFFIRRRATPPAIWKVSVDGGPPVQVSRLTNGTPDGFLSISPDGQWLAFRYLSAQPESAGEVPTLRIGVLPKDGNGEPKLFDLPMRRPIIQWSADSNSFYYSAGTFNSSSLLRHSLTGGASQKLLEFPDRVFNFAWSPDGKNLVVSRGKQQGDALLITNLSFAEDK
jgi:Tol biopolymer transport system component/DNA-binding winged helix-turn-helix (wHTH) protein